MTNGLADVLREAEGGSPVALARALVATPSVNPVLEPGGDGEARIARLAAGWLEGWGFDVDVTEVAAGRFNTVARKGPDGGRCLLLNGHLDTVGVEGMTVDPFGAALEGGRMWGRGSCDMKGGVASLLAAAAALSREDLPGALVVALTADEEHASLGMQAVVDQGVRADAAVVCEPTELAVMPANKGFVWLEAAFRGRAAHGSRPEVGVDAIRHAAAYLAALDPYGEALRARPPHPLLGHGSFHAGTIAGGSAPSVYPDRCTLVLERRTLPDETPERVVAEFQAVLDGVADGIPDLDARLSSILDRPGTEVDVDSELVRGLLDALDAGGLPPVVQGMTAWVDAALLNVAGIPAVCFGPGSIAQAHSADEWIEVDQIVRCAETLERFGRAFLGRG